MSDKQEPMTLRYRILEALLFASSVAIVVMLVVWWVILPACGVAWIWEWVWK